LPAAYLVGLTSVIFTSQHVRIGDLAAGTLLVFDNTEKETSFEAFSNAQQQGLSPQAAELVYELLDRWKTLEEPQRREIACNLLARLDPNLTVHSLVTETTADLHDRLKRLLPGRA